MAVADRGDCVSALRGLLIALGLAVGAYGVVLVLDNPTQIIIRIGVWAAAGVLLHDAVFAPACLALGFAARRILPRAWWSAFLVAGLCTVVLVLLAIPVYDKPGLQPDNASVLDRDYQWGFWVALAVVWAAALLYLIVNRVLPVRQNDVIEQQRSGNVEAQPPSV
jgi:hypothetical protein